MHIRFLLAAPLIALWLSGCSTYGSESIRERPADWPPMTMTKAELLETLGKPLMQSVTITDGKTLESLTWSYADAQMNPALFIPVVGLFVAGSGNGVSGESRALSAVFAADGKMISRSWVQNTIGK